MKTCPQCGTSYTDDSLSFCLTDGSPLQGAGDLSVSGGETLSLHEAATIHDLPPITNLSIANTQDISSPSLFNKSSIEFKLRQTNPIGLVLYSIGIAVVFLGAVGGVAYYFSRSSNSAKRNLINTANTLPAKVTANPNVPPAIAEKIKEECVAHIASWNKSNENRDIDAHISHYTSVVKNFYKDSDIDVNEIRLMRQRAYDRFQKLSINIGNLEIYPQSETEATARFDKTWVFESEIKFSSGSVKQELHLIKNGEKWLIDGEKDLEVHYINNRAAEDGKR